jgi:hypothetical protein
MRKYRGDDFAGSFVKFYLYGIEKPKKGKRGPVSA